MATSRKRKEESSSLQSNETYHLSRLQLIGGEINETTPNIVIYEIATSHGLVTDLNQCSFNNKILLSYIYETPIKIVNEPITREGWRYIARYINPQVNSWKEGNKLREAFQFIWQHQHLDITKISPDFIAGQQNPDQLYSFNACVLYGICVKHHLITWPTMSYDDLAFAVRSLLVAPSFIINHFIQQLQTCQHDQVINMCLNFYKANNLQAVLPVPECISYEQLERNLEYVTETNYLQDRWLPQQTNEVVALVAARYQLDISTSRHPFEELALLRRQGLENYQPYDPDMAKYYRVNPRLYSLNHHFNPLFAEQYYSGACLDALQQQSGHQRDNRVSSYSQLQEAYLCNSFHHGLRPRIKNNQSLYDLAGIDEVPSNQMITYGNPDEGYIFFTYSELADFFRINRAFLHPLEKRRQLCREEITQLRYLAFDNSYPLDDEDSAEKRKKLYQAMSYVDAFNLEVEENLKIFLDAYGEAEEEVQAKVKESFMKLFHCAMYMRGWLGVTEDEIDPYPIEVAPRRPDGEVYIRVCQSLKEWHDHLEALGPEWTKRIDNLPLVRYEDGFVVSNDVQIGQTIGEKIIIVEKGEDHSNTMGSCIRVSSGWLAASCHRYLTILGVEPPFIITKLAYVT